MSRFSWLLAVSTAESSNHIRPFRRKYVIKGDELRVFAITTSKRRKMATSMKREKKQLTVKAPKAAKTDPSAEMLLTPVIPAPMSMPDPKLFSDLLLLVDQVDDNAADNVSTKVNVGNEDNNDDNDNERVRKTSYTLGEKQDRVMVVTPNEVTITSTMDPHKTITFDANMWAHFIAVMTKVDDGAMELNRQTRPVVIREHLGSGYYISVTSGVMCVDFRKYYVPYGLPIDQARPTKTGISLRLDEWADLIQAIPSIHIAFPELAMAQRCVDDDSHLGQRGCTSCFPFGHEAAV